MADRHLLGDIALAILLVLPATALHRPGATIDGFAPGFAATEFNQAALADNSAAERRVSLFG